MTDTTNTFLEATAGDASAIAEYAIASAQPHAVEPGDLRLVVRPTGAEVIDLGQLAERPRRKAGLSTFYTAESFGRYVAEHKIDGTAVYGDLQALAVTAVINGHVPESEDAGWSDHRARLVLRHTPEWDRWKSLDGRMVDQATLADHLEIGQNDVVEPAAAVMLDLAKSFQATTTAEFREATVLESGQKRIAYDETVTAKAGQKGDLTIPGEFTIAVQPYEGSDRFRVVCRFRYRVEKGKLSLGYAMVRPEAVLEAAFNDVLGTVASMTELAPFAGSPGSA